MCAQGPLAEQQLSQATKQQSLRRPLRWAIGIHVVLFIVSYFGVPHMKRDDFDMTKAVSVDLVAPTGDISAAPNKTNKKTPFVPNAKPVQQKQSQKAQPEKPPAPVQSDAAKKEVIKKPEEKLEKPREKVEKPKKLATVKADDKPKIDKKKEKEKKSRDEGVGTEQEQQEFNSVLKNLLGAETPTETAPEGNPIDAPYEDRKVEGVAPTTSETLSLSDMDALKHQFKRCWNVPTGAMNAEDLIIDIRIQVNPDRTVKAAQIVDQSRYNSDDFFRAAADSARRAVFHPLCNPLAVSPEKYDVWKELLIRFNPREMFGG